MSLDPSNMLDTQITAMPAAEAADQGPGLPPPGGLPQQRVGQVLACVGWPTDEATGPVQSLLELAGALSNEFNFRVIARKRKFSLRADNSAPPGWERIRSVERYCCSMAWWGPRGFARLLRSTPHDILMLNGFFDPEFTIPALVLRRLGLVPRRPTILAPRGEFSKGALELKSVRKESYLKVVQRLRLMDDIWLHATGEHEADEIRAACPWAHRIAVAPNIRLLQPSPMSSQSDSANEPVRIVFMSRIDRKKNLDYALKVLARIHVPVVLDIYGPINDTPYWAECERLIALLPVGVNARYQGVIPNKAVCATLAGYDLFFLPTRGENFGHAIFDALEAGLPVLISDQTPWRDFGDAGYALPLADPTAFQVAIDQFARLGVVKRAAMRRAARLVAESAVKTGNAIARSRFMLQESLRQWEPEGPTV
jgi:glycosyltransferase involved in cell wall biosynthesis